MTTIFLDTPAVLKLIEIGGPATQLELTQAVVANVARSALKRHLPEDLRRMIDAEVVKMRETFPNDSVLRTIIHERLDDLRRMSAVSATKDPKVRAEALKVVNELFGDFIRGIVEEKTGTLEQFTAAKTDEVVERLGKRLDGAIEHDASVRVNALVKERVAAIIDGLGQKVAS